MDTIILLNDGLIEEMGSYEQLLKNKAGFSMMLVEHLWDKHLKGEDGELILSVLN